MTFANRKFIGFLGAATLVIIAEYVMVLSDCVIAGRTLGEDALGAVNLLMPVFSTVSFFTWLLAVGTSIVYSDAMARMQGEHAANLAGQGLVAAFVVGGILMAATWFLKQPYLAFMAPDAEMVTFASDYWRWYPLVALLEAVDLLLLYLVYTDGGERTCLVSYCVQVAVNVTLSYAFCTGAWGLPDLGMAGISLGTAIAYLVGLAILLPRLLNHAACGIRFTPKFLPGDFVRSLKSSFGDASAGLNQALLFFVVTKYVIHFWGSDLLPIATVVFCIIRLTVFFNGVGIALQPLETVYYGEGNSTGVSRLVRFAAIVSVVEGVILSGAVFIRPEWIISLVGIDEPFLLDSARHAVRLTVVGLSGYAIAYMLNSHYQFVGRPDRSIRLTVLAFFAVPVILLLALGRVLGMDGVWIALALGPAVAVGIFLLLQHRRVTSGTSPLMWSLTVSNLAAHAHIMDEVGRGLAGKLPAKTVNQITDVIGLALKQVRLRNGEGKRVNAEITVTFEESAAKLIIRDDGCLFAMDELGCPVQHLPAAGFNRNVFMFALPRNRVVHQYDVLRGKDVTLKAIEDVVELDKENYKEECYHKTAGYNYALFKTNNGSGIAIRERASGAIVGYSMLLPVSDETYAKIREGSFIDSNLTPDMVVKYTGPGIYHLYFASVVVHPDHRSARMVLTMLDAMVEDFLSLADRGIFIDRLVADVVSRDGAKFCRLFGLDKICASDHQSDIYEVSCLPPMFRETTPTTQRLGAVYRGKYAALHGNDPARASEDVLADELAETIQ